jgi:hypothetical protein
VQAAQLSLIAWAFDTSAINDAPFDIDYIDYAIALSADLPAMVAVIIRNRWNGT